MRQPLGARVRQMAGNLSVRYVAGGLSVAGRVVLEGWRHPSPPAWWTAHEPRAITRVRARRCNLHDFLGGYEWGGGWRNFGRHLAERLARFLAVPVLVAGGAALLAVAGYALQPWAFPALIVPWAAGDWAVRKFLGKGPERSVLRPGWGITMAGAAAGWVLGPWPLLVAIVLAGVLVVLIGLWVAYGWVISRPEREDAPGVPAAVARMLAHWERWHSESLGLRGVRLSYVDESGGEDRLLLRLTARVGFERTRSTLGRIDILLGFSPGSCRLERDPDAADRCYLFVRRPGDAARIDALAAPPKVPATPPAPPGPTPAERLNDLLRTAPGAEMAFGEIVAAMQPYWSRRTTYARVGDLCEKVVHGRYRLKGG